MIFTKSSHLYERVIEDIRKNKPEWIYILTYGLWAGVSQSGHVTDRCSSFRFFNYLNTTSVKVKVLVGYETNISRVLKGTQMKFKNIQFIAVPKMHSKAIVLSTGQVAIGSSNINDTWWGEMIRYGILDKDEFDDVVKHIHEQERHGGADVVDISELLKC